MKMFVIKISNIIYYIGLQKMEMIVKYFIKNVIIIIKYQLFLKQQKILFLEVILKKDILEMEVMLQIIMHSFFHVIKKKFIKLKIIKLLFQIVLIMGQFLEIIQLLLMLKINYLVTNVVLQLLIHHLLKDLIMIMRFQMVRNSSIYKKLKFLKYYLNNNKLIYYFIK